MSMEVSYRLNVSGRDPARESLLPPLPGATTYEPGTIDRIGEQVQSAWPLVAAGAIGGGVIGSKLLRAGSGGIFRGIVGGMVGVLGGASIAMAGLALARGMGDHVKPDPPVDAAVADTAVAAREKVKVMTWNVHGGMGGPKEFGSNEQELDALADVIRREQPDVLLLQEVDRFATRSNHTDVLAELDERLGADSAVGVTAMTQVTGRNQDVAVMTFNGFKVSDARNIVHPDSRGGGFDVRSAAFMRDAKILAGSIVGQDWSEGERYQVRNTIDAIVTTPGGTDVRVLSGHYEWPGPIDHQARQVGTIAGALDAWKGPTIWGADFNVRARSEHGARERKIMTDAGLTDTFRGTPARAQVSMTRIANDPDEAATARGGIDRIYVSDHAKVTSTARVVRDAGTASDHLPVVTEVELQPSSSTPGVR